MKEWRWERFYVQHRYGFMLALCNILVLYYVEALEIRKAERAPILRMQTKEDGKNVYTVWLITRCADKHTSTKI